MKKLGLFIIIAFFFNSCELEHIDNSPAEIVDKQLLLDLVNDIRSKGCNCGSTYMPPVNKVEWDYQLERAAIAHSIDMLTKNYFNHVSQDGATFSDRINGTDYTGRPGGENIAWGYSSEQAVFNGWLGSEGHCRNMMNGEFTDMAVGRSGNYWTMVFGIQ